MKLSTAKIRKLLCSSGDPLLIQYSVSSRRTNGFISQNQWRAFACHLEKPQWARTRWPAALGLPKRTQERIGSCDRKGLHIGRKASAHLLLHHRKRGLRGKVPRGSDRIVEDMFLARKSVDQPMLDQILRADDAAGQRHLPEKTLRHFVFHDRDRSSRKGNSRPRFRQTKP